MRRLTSRAIPSWRVIATTSAVVAAAVFFGFLLFAAHAMRTPEAHADRADGIIVLTGGDHRIVEGARLLKENAGRRLLISGVNPQTRRDDIVKLAGLDSALFRCCVDLGYAAQDTVGNAEEARSWVHGLGARRLIVVTSGYHMPRSLAELSLAMPGVELIAHPVVPKSVRARAWWLQPGLVRVLATEYAKFLPVAARYAVSRSVTRAEATTATTATSASISGW
ncbi:MAG: YdcF family protein [Hyphomicrobiaceae bacterium]|nr:YdcF family protein [Hyphomicrobiaceae bacterium]